MAEQPHLPHHALQSKAARGVSWNLMSAGAQRAVMYLSTLVLAHLLQPHDFGLVAIAGTVIYASSILRDLGLGDTLIQRPDLDRVTQGTVLTLMLGTGLLAAGALAGLAPVLAAFFHEPRLTSILLALAPVLVLGGLTGFYDNVLQREFQNYARFQIGLVQSVLYVGISVGLALMGFGVWSLVAAQLVSVALAAILELRVAAAFLVRPTFRRKAARDTLRNGRAFLAGGALDFIRQNTDYISIARFVSVAQLSYYFSAYRVCEFLGGSLSDAFTRVSFASFSRLRAQGHDLRQSYLSTLRLVGLVSCPVGVLLSGMADPFVRVAYGHKWLPMISVLSVLGLWITVRVLELTIGWLLAGAGEPGLNVKVVACSYAILLPCIIAAAVFIGIVAVAWVMVLNNLATGLIFSWFLARKLDLSQRSQWRAVRPVAIACIPTWLVSRGIAVAIHQPVLGLPLATIAGIGAYVATLAIVEPGIISWLLRQAQKVVRPHDAAPSPI